MMLCLITFRSVTPAQKGEAVLRRAGYICNLQRTPRWMEAQGCGYSLRVRYEDVSSCVQLLRKGNISFRKVYLHKADGSTEEMDL